MDKYQVIMSGRGAPTLADVENLTAPDDVSLTETLEMARSAHAYLRVVLYTMLGRYHPSSHGMESLCRP